MNLQKISNELVIRSDIVIIAGCSEPAIDSHILQKNGILKLIAEKQHLYHLGKPNYFKNNLVDIERVGINEVFTFKGFCKHHDNIIFKEIESGLNLDFWNYRTQLLLSYRGVLNELRKKEITKEYYEWMLSDPKSDLIMDKAPLIESIKGTEYGIKDISTYKELIENNLSEPEKNEFKFSVYSYPKIDICTSSFYSIAFNEEQLMDFDNGSFHLAPAIIVNLLPTQTDLIIIIGYLRKFQETLQEMIDSFNQKNYSMQLKRISDYLLLDVETWACSETLYTSTLEKHSDEIIKIIMSTAMLHEQHIQTDFNMFQDLIPKQ